MKNDIITLKNGKRVELEWSFLVLEYLEEYPGGIKELTKDIKFKRNEIKINNIFCYASIRANIDEPLTYHEILKLIDLKSLKTILKFIEKNADELEEFKKKEQTYLPRKKKRNTKKKH